MSDLPTWLIDALRENEPPIASPADQRHPEVGSLVRVVPIPADAGSPRLALILDANPRTFSFSIALATNRVDDRTSSDLLVEARESHLPYDLAIETDVIGVCLESQVGPMLGEVPPQVLTAARSALTGEIAAEVRWRRGIPLHGVDDERWAWKEAEVDAMRLLAAHASELLLAPAVMDPALFDTSAAPNAARVVALLDAADRIVSGHASLPPWVLDALALTDEVTRERLRTAIGPDAWIAIERALFRVLESEGSTTVPMVDTPEMPGRAGRRHRDPLPLLVAERADAGFAATRVWTVREQWESEGALDIETAEGSHCLIREFVDAA